MRVVMVIASGGSYLINEAIAKARYGNVDKMNFEHPLTSLVWITSLISVATTYAVSYLLLHNLPHGWWWKLSSIITCGTLACPILPQGTNDFPSPSPLH